MDNKNKKKSTLKSIFKDMLSFKEMETRIDSNVECRKKKPKNSKPVSRTHTQRKGPVSS